QPARRQIAKVDCYLSVGLGAIDVLNAHLQLVGAQATRGIVGLQGPKCLLTLGMREPKRRSAGSEAITKHPTPVSQALREAAEIPDPAAYAPSSLNRVRFCNLTRRAAYRRCSLLDAPSS